MPRKRSPHPGVIYIPPRPTKRQRAGIRYRDPDSGKIKTQTIPAEIEDVKAWLGTRAFELQLRRVQLRQGAPRATGGALAEAITAYYAEAAIRESTAAMYKFSTDLFQAWAESARVRSADELTLAKLRDFRAWVRKRPGRASAHTTNRDLRTVAAVLEHLRRGGRCAHLTRDAIADGLERLRAPVERKDFLRPDQVRALIIACAEREPRILGFVLLALLTGMRRGELLETKRQHLSVNAGELYLPADVTKTGQARTIDMSVSNVLPALADKYLPLALTQDQVREAQRRLGLAWTPHMLRRTCGTYLACAPGIWGAASVFLTARQLGHSVTIAEKHYLGRIKIAPEVKTLEAAYGISDLSCLSS